MLNVVPTLTADELTPPDLSVAAALEQCLTRTADGFTSPTTTK